MRLTVLSVIVRVRHGNDDDMRSAEVAVAFDPIRTADQARSAGRAIGEVISDNLARRLQHGEDLAA